MVVRLKDIGKEYRYHWVFRHLDCMFRPGEIYAIRGPNGSGKSTLLQIISGFLTPSEGRVRFEEGEKGIHPAEWYRYLSLAAPYVDLPEELTLEEFLRFHFRFKDPVAGLSQERILSMTNLPGAEKKLLKEFSSGMKQRVRLVSAILSRTELLLLDEPSTNLDEHSFDWFCELLEAGRTKDRIIVIASNERRDLELANQELFLAEFKD